MVSVNTFSGQNSPGSVVAQQGKAMYGSSAAGHKNQPLPCGKIQCVDPQHESIMLRAEFLQSHLLRSGFSFNKQKDYLDQISESDHYKSGHQKNAKIERPIGKRDCQRFFSDSWYCKPLAILKSTR